MITLHDHIAKNNINNINLAKLNSLLSGFDQNEIFVFDISNKCVCNFYSKSLTKSKKKKKQ
jgi:hypothetical protein